MIQITDLNQMIYITDLNQSTLLVKVFATVGVC